MSAYQYIIVVHGMGESRYGETILPVISRCAEVVNEVLAPEEYAKQRKVNYEKVGRDIVTLGAFVGASPWAKGPRPWVEFSGIPTDALEDKPFTGIATHSPEGKLVRFVDVWWKDLVDQSEHVLEPASPWADGLIGRIKRTGAKAPTWMPQLLFKLQDVLGPLQTILRSRVPDVEQLAFNKYLGDVQIYAEYEPMRGTAVRRFHETMDAVCKAHFASLPKQEGSDEPATTPPPQFTIISHSLGSIMSLDALMFAHQVDPFHPLAATPNLPFPGYEDSPNAVPDTDWIKYVKTFVTLGSPIDKFLLFWPYRYQYLNATQWIDKSRLNGRPRIRHINYCDEQDPVGQSLDTLRSTDAYKQLFTATYEDHAPGELEASTTAGRMVQRVTQSLKQYMVSSGAKATADLNNDFDVVYRRTIWPGLAHTSYWKDKGLFRNILEHVLKNKAGSADLPNVVGDKRVMYVWITLLTYFVVPLVIVAVDTVAYDMFLEPVSWKGYYTIGLIFVGACWLSRETVNILVWWRQLLRNKRSREVVPQSLPSIFVKWIVRLGLPLLAFGFAQVAIKTSGGYVQSIKDAIASSQATIGVDGTAAKTLWPDVPWVLEPFQLISGTTVNMFAFWVALISLLVLLILYRIKSSNFKESSKYEAYLSFPVDIIVFISGYWLLLTIWRGDASANLIAGNIWEHPMGWLSVIALGLWHVYRIGKDLLTPGKNEFLQKAQEVVISAIVLIVGWMIVAEIASWIVDLAPESLSPDARKRITYFSFIGVIVWVYMALRFYVAKAQLGSDKVPVFREYYKM